MSDVKVEGRTMTISLADFEHRCRVLIAHEQEEPLPDNALISVLCEGVRLARAFEDIWRPRCHDDLLAALKEPRPTTEARKLPRAPMSFTRSSACSKAAPPKRK